MAWTSEDRKTAFTVAITLLYWALSIVVMVLFLRARAGATPSDIYMPYVLPLWDASHDPVFAFLIRAAIVIVGIALIPGALVALVGFFILLLAVSISVQTLGWLLQLATVSSGGAILVLGLLAALAWWFLSAHPEQTRRMTERMHRLFDLVIAAYVRAVRPAQDESHAYSVMNAERGRKMDNSDEQERGLRTQVMKVAEVLGLGRVPAQLEDYDGWLREAWKRVQMRSVQRTRSEALALLQQATAAHGELLKLRRTQAELDRLGKENTVKNLELDEQKYCLRLKIEEHKRAIKNIIENPNVPPPENLSPSVAESPKPERPKPPDGAIRAGRKIF